MKNKRSKKMMALVVIMALMIQLVAATYVEAAAKKTKTSTSNSTYVAQVNRNGGLVGIPTKIRKNIKTKISRWHFCRILKDLYEGRINLASSWLDEATLTQAWACGILSTVTAQMGVKVNWSGGSSNAKVDLGTACKLIVLTINTSPKLRPTRWS